MAQSDRCTRRSTGVNCGMPATGVYSETASEKDQLEPSQRNHPVIVFNHRLLCIVECGDGEVV